ELARLLLRSALHAHLPRGEAAVELLLLPGLAGRLVVPAVLLVEPVLDPARARLDSVLAEHRLHDRVSLFGRGAGRGVDVDGVLIARDREPVSLQVACELARLGAEVAREPVEETRRVLLLDLDRDAPVVVRHRAEPSLRGWTGASCTGAPRRATRPARRESSTSGSSCSSRIRPGRPGSPCSWTATARELRRRCGGRRRR